MTSKLRFYLPATLKDPRSYKMPWRISLRESPKLSLGSMNPIATAERPEVCGIFHQGRDMRKGESSQWLMSGCSFFFKLYRYLWNIKKHKHYIYIHSHFERWLRPLCIAFLKYTCFQCLYDLLARYFEMRKSQQVVSGTSNLK